MFLFAAMETWLIQPLFSPFQGKQKFSAENAGCLEILYINCQAALRTLLWSPHQPTFPSYRYIMAFTHLSLTNPLNYEFSF